MAPSPKWLSQLFSFLHDFLLFFIVTMDFLSGVTSWNTPYSKFISIMGVTFAMAFILYDLAFYVHHMLGDQRQLLHFISYCGFLACLSTYPVLNICSKIRSFLGQNGKFSDISWATTLNLRFIIRRLQVLDLHKKGKVRYDFFEWLIRC